ncbi:MAG: hypothetical protein WCW52_05700 [Elusimicrobiales bacterium]|jgi:hypothetical protein
MNLNKTAFILLLTVQLVPRGASAEQIASTEVVATPATQLLLDRQAQRAAEYNAKAAEYNEAARNETMTEEEKARQKAQLEYEKINAEIHERQRKAQTPWINSPERIEYLNSVASKGLPALYAELALQGANSSVDCASSLTLIPLIFLMDIFPVTSRIASSMTEDFNPAYSMPQARAGDEYDTAGVADACVDWMGALGSPIGGANPAPALSSSNAMVDAVFSNDSWSDCSTGRIKMKDVYDLIVLKKAGR